MAPETLSFDEDGDLILILSKPATKRGESTNAPHTTNLSDGGKSIPQAEEENLAQDLEVRLLVSSKHMMVASPVFKAMLHQSKFKEGRKLHRKGSLELSLPDDNVMAMKILLDIIHGRIRRVPRNVSLNQFAQISILVDKYQMAEAVEVISDVWIKSLERNMPTSYDPDLVGPATEVHHWLGISWVFGKADQFKAITQLIVFGCGPDFDLNVEGSPPIPVMIIGRCPSFEKDTMLT